MSLSVQTSSLVQTFFGLFSKAAPKEAPKPLIVIDKGLLDGCEEIVPDRCEEHGFKFQSVPKKEVTNFCKNLLQTFKPFGELNSYHEGLRAGYQVTPAQCGEFTKVVVPLPAKEPEKAPAVAEKTQTSDASPSLWGGALLILGAAAASAVSLPMRLSTGMAGIVLSVEQQEKKNPNVL